MKRFVLVIMISMINIAALAQSAVTSMPDTTNLYGERKDSLKASVKVGRQAGNYLSKGKDIRTEVISAAGLCKMACCNLAESFENSASVTVGYSDAVTGARQIRLLGQSGIYTQMLDENRPVMRGLSAPWGLNFIPSQWLESIQIAKGVTSVINGVESMTGQINMEHRKPTDEKPLYLQASYMSDTKADLNVVSAVQFDEESKWSTVLLGHVDGNFRSFDHNGDGFMDDPRQFNASISNRWLYFSPTGLQVRFGVRGILDNRLGGQSGEKSGSTVIPNRSIPSYDTDAPWQAAIQNRSAGSYVKVGVPLNEDNSCNIAFVADYTYQWLKSSFGNEERLPQMAGIYYSTFGSAPNPFCRTYDAGQHSLFFNALYQNQSSGMHHFTLGLSEMMDIYNESFCTLSSSAASRLSDFGAFGEYTFHSEDEKTFSAIVGLRADWYNQAGARFSPRLTLKWAPSDQFVLRANGGRGLRYSTPLIDNIGILSTGKTIEGDILSHPLEESWTFGGNATWYIGGSSSNYLSIDYFGTRFVEQMLVDYDAKDIRLYKLSSVAGAYSRTDNLQLDFNIEPFKGFTATLTGRLTDARQTLLNQSGDIKPMTSRYKGVLNLQYATNLNKWIFDFTASVNGPCRVWDFMKAISPMYADGFTPVYPLLYAQVTKRFKGFDIYLGGENLTGYVQPSPIINASNPFSSGFDASCIWGPLMGAKIYGGIRLTIWKTE